METVSADLPTKFGRFKITAFKDGMDVAVAVHKSINTKYVTPVRIHSQCLTGDVFFSMRCDCRAQLEFSLRFIEQNGGLVIYLFQEGRGIGIFNKIKAYSLQDGGCDTVDANEKIGVPVDNRSYEMAVKILNYFGIKQICLITNNPDKYRQISKHADIITVLHPVSAVTEYNKKYLITKREKLKHDIILI